MEKTQFLGITTLGPTDSIYDDNAAFLSRDRLELDRAAEIGVKIHRHTGLPGLSNPEVSASAEVVASAGQIASDLIISVGYTLQDDSLGETELSPVAIVSTPGPMSIPQIAPSAALNYASGSLLTNSYYYAITYVDGEGGETPLGPPVIAEREPGFPNGQVELSNLNVGMEAAGAVGWRLYRSIGGGTYGLLAEGEDGTFIDDGSKAADCQVNPPGDNVNTTNQVSTLFVTLPEIGQSAAFINLYANIDGDFSGASLLAQYPIASAGETVSFETLSFLDSSPPDTNRSYGGAPKIDPDTEILDWHWKRPVKTVGELPTEGNEEGDVRAILEAEEPTFYVFLGGEWQPFEAGGGALSVRLAGGGEGGAFVYWADDSGNNVGRVNQDGTEANKEFIDLASNLQHIAVSTTHIYWADEANDISRALLDGTEVELGFIAVTGVPNGVAVDDTYIYWADNNTEMIGRARLDGTEVDDEFFSIGGFFGTGAGVDVDDEFIYWVTGSTIGRARKDGTEIDGNFIEGIDTPKDIATNDTHIFWSSAGTTDAIGRANLDGSSVEKEWVTAPENIRGIAVDDLYVYWADLGPDSIGRVKLDGSEATANWTSAGFTPIGVAVSRPQVTVSSVEAIEFAGSGIATVGLEDLGSGTAKITVDVPEVELLDITASGTTVFDARELEFIGSGGVTISETEPAADLAEVLVEGDRALLAQEGMGVIVHGAEAGVARPNRFKQYTWIGSVEPENMAEFDIWIETE